MSDEGISRRTIVAAAWAAPVVVAAAAAPAAAASEVGAYVFDDVSARNEGGPGRRVAAVTGFVTHRATGAAASGVVLTVTYLPSAIVDTVATDSSGFFASLRLVGEPQVTCQVSASDGSTTGVVTFSDG